MAAKIRVVITETAVNQAANTSTITIKVQYYGNGQSYNGYSPSGSVTVNGTERTFSHSFTKSQSWQTLYAKTGVSIAHNADGSKTVSYSASFATGVSLGTLKTSGNVTLTKIARSWAVTYNANGGSGAPASQTKAYGTTLTLSSIVPTRPGYRFLGWNTTAAGTGTDYSPGASYTGNAALTLYAKWELAYKAPTIDAINTYRVNAAGEYDEEGTDIYVSFAFTPAKHYENGEWVDATTVPTFSVKIGNNTFAPTATWMRTNTHSYSTSNEYEVQVTVEYLLEGNTYKATKTTFISMSVFTMDINSDGSAVGFGRPAPDSAGHAWDGVFLKDVDNAPGALTAALAAKGLAGKSLEEVITYILGKL